MEATPCTTSMPHPPPLEPSSATQARHCRAPTAPMFCCCRQHPPRATIHCTQNIHSLYSCFFGEPKKLASGGTEAYMCKCLGQHDRALRIGAAEVWPMLCRCRQQQDRPHRHALHLLTLPLQDRPHAMAPHRLWLLVLQQLRQPHDALARGLGLAACAMCDREERLHTEQYLAMQNST